ncbi:HU family DNA-binding protein [Longimicrobium terrae]|uniref:Nucleoid DNA-binding protein n=1 Tax=Longimicrobium terrae TaxID=1639882 RepID=A0A841H4F4_9BACT|nr:HU family DNA-binding protein [Longimicrobium terrae]MBB4638866.1 nucleoid DNA-binding protein [Longimicrobium terrae]MBB6073105.1 nucleoid DNA-binding protein [Longimicrobium terrae]
MNKAQFIDQVADKAQLSKAAAQRAVDAIFDTAGGAISETVHSLGELSIPGFGKFTKKTRAARTGRNPRTGAEIQIPERSSIGFTAGKNLREGTISGRRKAAGAVAGAALGAAAGAAAATAGAPKKGGVNSGASAEASTGDTASSGAKASGGAKGTGAAKSGGTAAKGKSGGAKGGSAKS